MLTAFPTEARDIPWARFSQRFIPVLAGALSAASAWRTWINPFVDSSREMNVPARLAMGERLYRDVVYHYGPAAPWINAFALDIFGRHFWVLEAAGLSAAVLLFVALFHLTVNAGSSLSACLAVTWAAALCMGAPNGGSFLFPYSFGALFAIAGGFGCLAAASEGPTRIRQGLAAAGLALALAAKPEIGAAAAAVLLVAAIRSKQPRNEKGAALRIILFASLLAGALYVIAFAGLPWDDLFPEGPFALFSPPEPWRNVYRLMSGFADPAGAVRSVATALFLDLLILAAAFGASKVTARPRLAALAWGLGVASIGAFFCSGAGGALDDRLPPLLAPLPVLSAAAALALLRSPLDRRDRARWLLFGFSAAVASRVILGLAYGSVTTPYSVLAFPGLAATASVLVLDALANATAAPRTMRGYLAVIFAALSLVAVVRWKRLLAADSRPLLQTSAGSLRLRADHAAAAAGTLRFLSSRAHSGDTLSGFPEAGFFNFVTGLRNPLRQEQVLPGHLDAAGEARLIRSLETRGPRFLLLANQPTAAFGAVSFGTDYATGIAREIERRYRVAGSFGAAPPGAPIGSPIFFLRVYERIE